MFETVYANSAKRLLLYLYVKVIIPILLKNSVVFLKIHGRFNSKTLLESEYLLSTS